MVKVTKWDKKKKNEQNKRKYKLLENLRYILSEIWKSQPLMLVLLLVGLIAIVAESLFTTFTGKYVVELTLGTSSRVQLAVIAFRLLSASGLQNIFGMKRRITADIMATINLPAIRPEKSYAKICPRTTQTMKAVKTATPYKKRG